MQAQKGLVIVPNKNGKIKIPDQYFVPLTLSFTTNQVAIVFSEGRGLMGGNGREKDPAAIFLDIGLPNSEKKHHVETFIRGGKPQVGKSKARLALDNATNFSISDNGIIGLPSNILELFKDTSTRARVLTLNGQGGKFDGFALQFTPRFPKR